MVILLSPAKTLDMDNVATLDRSTQPAFLDDSEKLVKKLARMSRSSIGELMKLSPQLADLNYNRYKDWSLPFTDKNARTALDAFQGDVYRGLDAASFNKTEVKFAQKHLRILSGLYGLLRPLDLMQAYRLEMGTRWEIDKKTKNLYAYWGDKITLAINETLKANKNDLVVNLASNEYFKAVNTNILTGELITPVFKQLKGEEYKNIAIFSKIARGQMTAFMVKSRIKDKESLKAFDVDGYAFNEPLSNDAEFVFTR